MARESAETEELVDVRHAAALTGRHPETVRRWVWSGRLAARRQGRRLLLARADVEALAGVGAPTTSLAAWAERARAARARGGGSGRSSADLVLADRKRRSGGEARGSR